MSAAPITQEAAREMLAALAISETPVGSRVTCSPAPTDTDDDVLLLIRQESLDQARQVMADHAIDVGSSCIGDGENMRHHDDRFYSYKIGETNLIITASENFHRRFLAASSVARSLNLLRKCDRVMLFQAVLYGNVVNCAPIAAIQRAEGRS